MCIVRPHPARRWRVYPPAEKQGCTLPIFTFVTSLPRSSPLILSILCGCSADQPPPTPSQTTRLFARLAEHMAAQRRVQIARGVLPLVGPSFSELGGGGGVSGAVHGKGGAFMSRVAIPAAPGGSSTAGAGAGAGASAVAAPGSSGGPSASASSSAAAPCGDGIDASSFSPNVKIAIVAHTAITLYTCTPVELRLPQRFVPRYGGPAQALTGGAAAFGPSSASGPAAASTAGPYGAGAGPYGAVPASFGAGAGAGGFSGAAAGGLGMP